MSQTAVQQPSPFLCACPNCGAQGEVTLFLMQQDFAAVVRLCTDLLGTQGDVLMAYLGLFKPAKHRMTVKRAHDALAELVPMMTAGSFKRGGNTYSAPRDAWTAGMQAVLASRATITPPLTSHAYLLTVMASIMDKAQDKATAKADASRDNERRNRVLNSASNAVSNDDGVGDFPQKGTQPSPQVREQIMKSLANIGKNMTFGANKK